MGFNSRGLIQRRSIKIRIGLVGRCQQDLTTMREGSCQILLNHTKCMDWVCKIANKEAQWGQILLSGMRDQWSQIIIKGIQIFSRIQGSHFSRHKLRWWDRDNSTWINMQVLSLWWIKEKEIDLLLHSISSRITQISSHSLPLYNM